MKILYSPCQSFGPETQILYTDENSISIDGEVYAFDPTHVAWPTISGDTSGIILAASRDSGGEIHLTVRRFYQSDCGAWDRGEVDFAASGADQSTS